MHPNRILALALVLLAGFWAPASAAQEQPNILWIVADDLSPKTSSIQDVENVITGDHLAA